MAARRGTRLRISVNAKMRAQLTSAQSASGENGRRGGRVPRVDARSARRFGLSRALLRCPLLSTKLGALTLVPERRVVPCPSAHLAVRNCAGAASNSGDATRVASKSQISSTCGTPPVRQLGSSRYRPASSRPAARPPIVRASTFVLWARIMAELRRHSASLTTDQGNRPELRISHTRRGVL